MREIPPYVYETGTLPQCLQQGDIIKLSNEFRELFFRLFEHLKRDDIYDDQYMMVTSQSCDLFRDGKRDPKPDHINLCTVRSFNRYLKRVSESVGGFSTGYAKVVERDRRVAISGHIAGVINNSNIKQEFFLPKGSFFSDNLIAFLTLSYPIKTESYDVILKERVCSLKPEFQAKVGYTIAELYGRVATSDLVGSGWEYDDITKCASEFLDQMKIYQVDSAHLKTVEEKLKANPPEQIEFEKVLNNLVIEIKNSDFQKKAGPYRGQIKSEILSDLDSLIEDDEQFEKLKSMSGKDRKIFVNRHLSGKSTR